MFRCFPVCLWNICVLRKFKENVLRLRLVAGRWIVVVVVGGWVIGWRWRLWLLLLDHNHIGGSGRWWRLLHHNDGRWTWWRWWRLHHHNVVMMATRPAWCDLHIDDGSTTWWTTATITGSHFVFDWKSENFLDFCIDGKHVSVRSLKLVNWNES